MLPYDTNDQGHVLLIIIRHLEYYYFIEKNFKMMFRTKDLAKSLKSKCLTRTILYFCSWTLEYEIHSTVPFIVSDPFHFDADPDPVPRIRFRDNGSGSRSGSGSGSDLKSNKSKHWFHYTFFTPWIWTHLSKDLEKSLLSIYLTLKTYKKNILHEL